MPLLLLLHPRVSVQAEVATVYLDLQPSSSETYTTTDAATVYLDLQAISFVPATMDLVCVGMSRRFVLTTTSRFGLQASFRWVKQLTVRRRYQQEGVDRKWKSLLRTR